MLDFWGWLIEGERPRCVRRGVRRVSPLNRLACPMRDGRGGCRSFREWLRLPYPSMPIFEARALTKPSFRRAFRSRRCLVVADGFYEWRRADGRKQPYFVGLRGDRPFGLAG